MLLNRYENLRRYLHISKPGPIPSQQPPEPYKPRTETQQSPQPLEHYSEDSEDEVEAETEVWWWRLEPLLSTFRIACKTYLIPGTEVAIDEIIVRCHGRSADTCKIPNKPIKQGYKIFALAEDGYI